MQQVFASDFRKNMKEYMDAAVDEPIIIDRRSAPNLVVLSLKDYKALLNDEERAALNQAVASRVEGQIEEVVRRLLKEYENKKK